jgi:hypothetical protein
MQAGRHLTAGSVVMLGCIFGTCGILHCNVKWGWLSLQYMPYSLHCSAVLLQQSTAVSCPGLFPLNAYATALGWGELLRPRTELRYLSRCSVLAFMLLGVGGPLLRLCGRLHCTTAGCMHCTMWSAAELMVCCFF